MKRRSVTLPAPSFRGLRQGETLYVAIDDVVRLLRETAVAFDNVAADNDFGRAFRATATAIERSKAKPA